MVIKEYNDAYEHYISYCHNSLKHNYCYFEFNNEIIGIIINDNEGESINMLYNTETELFYIIKINDDNEDNDEVKNYMKEEIPDELKKNEEFFLEVYKFFLKKKANNDNISIEEQISFSQSSEVNSLSNENSIISQNKVLDKTNLVYVRKKISNKNVTIFFLSDRTVEAIFADKVKILISDINHKIEIINQNNKINLISSYYVFDNSNHDFTRRIKYVKNLIIKDIMEKNIKDNKVNNFDK